MLGVIVAPAAEENEWKRRLVTIPLGVLFLLLFVGGAGLLSRARPGRRWLSFFIAALLPFVLIASVISGLLRQSDMIPALAAAAVLFGATYAFASWLLRARG